MVPRVSKTLTGTSQYKRGFNPHRGNFTIKDYQDCGNNPYWVLTKENNMLPHKLGCDCRFCLLDKINEAEQIIANLLEVCEKLIAWDNSDGDVKLISEACSLARQVTKGE